jgi:hypothetical protein
LYEYKENEGDAKQNLDSNQKIIELRDFDESQVKDYLVNYF